MPRSETSRIAAPPKLSVAPMMEWTDRHCRYFHRLLSRHTLLYTEMITAAAVVHGNARELLRLSARERPVALQLGGSDPELLSRAVSIASEFGYGEINLNVGCPSDRVQSGRFGAALMKEPGLVADCVEAMIESAGGSEITVKCRIGVDDQDPGEVLPAFIEAVSARGARRFIIHARKAILKGLSPKENREVPPLNYALAFDMKRAFPDLWIVVNGGITSLGQVERFIASGLDGAMIGRAAYKDPASVLLEADRRVFSGAKPSRNATRAAVVQEMIPYIEAHLSEGGRLHQVTRHMLGLFTGLPGARKWRRILSDQGQAPGAGPETLLRALAEVEREEALVA